MPKPEFRFEITDQSVSVQLNVAGKSRFCAAGIYAGLIALGLCLLLFLPGKHSSPSIWQDLAISHIDSGRFLFDVCLLLGSALLMLALLGRWTLMAFPSDETFHCDCSTLTMSRVPWFDVHNSHWETRSFPLSEVAGIRYRAVANSKASSIYGLGLSAGGKTWKILPGLKARDAEKIFAALKVFGADVSDDKTLQRRLKEEF
ncbi:MAG: hypothetical protein WBD06_15530 [Acidobacteriaceae bacterium]